MSFLLDALRKSENQKQLGHVPTIHSTEGLDFSPNRRRRPGLIMVLVLPAVLVFGWYGWKYFMAEDEGAVTQPVARSCGGGACPIACCTGRI